jgi:CubicO group peptidase (beta-lactamase class C family)
MVTTTAAAATTSPPTTATTDTTTGPTTAITEADPCADQIPDDVERMVREAVDAGDTMGIVVGIVGPCGAEYFAYGRSAAENGPPLGRDTVFEIGSTGKAFTGVLLAAMVEANLVSMSDPIESFLPPGVQAPFFEGRSITLRDLATHTSGLPSLPGNFAPADEYRPYADYTVEQMYQALGAVELTRPPGAEYEYSNFGMGVLGHLLELQSGMSYEELVAEWITVDLGMTDTRMELTAGMKSRLATGYRHGEPFPLWDNPTLAGAGGLRSTAGDMLEFLAANLGLRESDVLGAMRLSHRPVHVVDPALSVGLAWHLLTEGDDTVVEHHGATGGYWCYAGFVEDRRLGVVVLTNSFFDVDGIGRRLLRGS